MKAVQFAQYGTPEVLQLREVSDPTPAADDVLVHVRATTVNHLDLFQRNGSRPVEQLPFTPGLEAAGIVMSDAHGFKAGERVLTTRALAAKGGGGYASIIAVPVADLVRIPDSLSFEQAVSAGLTASTAWHGMFDLGQLQPKERVLIWAGSSGVGSIGIQLAKHIGAWIATTASSEARARTLHEQGADLVINYHQQDVAQVLQTQGGVDLVIELVGTTLQTSLAACRPRGRIVLIGNLGGQQATVDTQTWRLKRVNVIGGGGQMRTSRENEQRILQLITQQAITPLIARTMPIEEAAKAHHLLETGEVQGKIVLLHN